MVAGPDTDLAIVAQTRLVDSEVERLAELDATRSGCSGVRTCIGWGDEGPAPEAGVAASALLARRWDIAAGGVVALVAGAIFAASALASAAVRRRAGDVELPGGNPAQA